MLLSKIEQHFADESGSSGNLASIPYLVVDNFPKLGLLTALSFLDWVSDNPNGVVSLPTGKTPEYFIKWTNHILRNWKRDDVIELRSRYDLKGNKPDLSELSFVQIDEFFPIDPTQHNSFYYYVQKYYIEGFRL